ncbi:hypothetical protein [Novosphingobium sp. CECT 9465]|uniref:hypothetical protein n=1 Tax=Novosphingobium sp. CECT 9465 TaxID=2829794 RepID=UPI001E29D7FE|nr:hypothetical protein [Novosphingobium sp. CECT 9465]CAH0497227.1 hypothetical protein NVSP9465_02279 [Novosphingobium sp. CECT 9465]
MINFTFPESRLAQDKHNPHRSVTNGPSRWGGVRTSNSRRRSRFLGRVVVAHVQGSPKGGDALGLLRVLNTRLCPVPPLRREARMRHNVALITCTTFFALIFTNPAAAQSSAVDSDFCDRGNFTDAASQLTRDWGERYRQTFVEQAVKAGSVSHGSVVSSTGSVIVCRVTFASVTSTVPAHRVELRDVEFRYSRSTGSIEPVTLPLTGFDERTSIAAIWERVFLDDRSYRSMVEEKAEHDPAMAAAVAAVAGRPKGTENATWEPEKFCPKIGVSIAAAGIIHWAETTSQVHATGLTARETPTWLPATAWTIGNFKLVSSIPFQSVICSADVTYIANGFDGKHIPMQIRGMPYKVWGNDDGSEMYADVHNWPTEEQQKDGNNAFNRAWVVNGQTFEQAEARRRQRQQADGGPKNIIEAMAQQQAAANKQAEEYLRAQGMPVDQMKAADQEKTRKYAEPCRQHGGTWGYPTRNGVTSGQLGCYFPRGDK